MSIMILHHPYLAPRSADCLTGAGGPGRARAWFGIALASLLLAVSCLAASWAQPGFHSDARGALEESRLERNVKAAFLYKFLAYVEFPEGATPANGEPYVIGVLGAAGAANAVADEVADEIRRIAAGRTLNGRPVQLRRLRPGDAMGGLHLLFIADADAAGVDRALAAVRHAPVLTVTQMPASWNARRADSVVNFRLVDERVRFEVSLEAADKNNLKLSSRLLAVAYKVARSGS